MLKEYFNAFEQDRDFRSRTGRKKFWRAIIPDIIIIAVIIAGIILFEDFRSVFVIAGTVYLLLTMTSRLALWTRRLHDTGLKGTFAFIFFIPVIGILALWFVFASDSQPKNNDYGEYVKEQSQKKNTPKSKKK